MLLLKCVVWCVHFPGFFYPACFAVLLFKRWLPTYVAVADLGKGGGTRDARFPPLDPISFIFMQFLGKIWKNYRFLLPPMRLAPPPVWEILDPPLHNDEHREKCTQSNDLKKSNAKLRRRQILRDLKF